MRAPPVFVVVAALLWGCSADVPSQKSHHRPSVDTDSDPTVGLAGQVDATCVPAENNTLRADCTVTLSSAASLVFNFGVSDQARVLTFEPASVHTFTVTGLTAQTTYDFTAAAGGGVATGSFTTGVLNDQFPAISVTGEATFDFLLFAHNKSVMLANSQGQLVWYEHFLELGDGPQKGRVTGTHWVGDGVALGIASGLYEIGLDGTHRFESLRGVGHELPLHHDVFVRDGLRYVLNVDGYTYGDKTFAIDGFYVFDDDGLRGEWHLADHLEADPVWTGNNIGFWNTEWPGSEDFAHSNAIFATEDGTIMFSSRRLDNLYAIAGVDSPNFGDVLWRVNGSGGGDFTIVGAADGKDDFNGQHHVQLHGDVLTVFDNRSGDNARTIAMTLDHANGTATIGEIHSLHQSCAIQGANFTLESGNVVATCGSDYDIYEFVGGVDEPAIWSMHVDAKVIEIPRGIPIEQLPPGW